MYTWLLGKSVQFSEAGILRGYMAWWGSLGLSSHICQALFYPKVWASYTQNGVVFRYFTDGRHMHTLFVFSNSWFSCFKELYYFIFYLCYLTDVEGNLTDLSVSTNAICQALEITLQGLFSELHWINSTRLFKHACLLPTWSKWFDYLFTEIMTQGADYGFNFIWLMDLDFSCTLSSYAYPPTVQLPHWYAFFLCLCVSSEEWRWYSGIITLQFNILLSIPNCSSANAKLRSLLITFLKAVILLALEYAKRK